MVVELHEQHRMPVAEDAQDREHQEVQTVFEEARQDLNAARRSRGFFLVEATDTAYNVNDQRVDGVVCWF